MAACIAVSGEAGKVPGFVRPSHAEEHILVSSMTVQLREEVRENRAYSMIYLGCLPLHDFAVRRICLCSARERRSQLLEFVSIASLILESETILSPKYH